MKKDLSPKQGMALYVFMLICFIAFTAFILF